MLFSEPKIPQFFLPRWIVVENVMFQCSSASRKFLNSGAFWAASGAKRVSVLFSEPKIPQSGADCAADDRDDVSVLFSEPKIPQ